MKTPHQQRVEQFMTLARQDIPSKPTVPSDEIRRLRAKLVLEEALELVQELGFVVEVSYYDDYEGRSYSIDVDDKSIELVLTKSECEIDLDKLAKESADLSVVNTGTLSACGIHDGDVIKAVDENNLAKFGPGHSYREDGKLIKPPGFKSPDIQSVLDNQEGEF